MSNERSPLLLRNAATLFFVLFASSACSRKTTEESDAGSPPPPASIATVATLVPPIEAAPATPIEPIGSADRLQRPSPQTPTDKPTPKLLAAGDVSFGRLLGQMLLRDSSFKPFASMEPLFRSVDIRFVNLEGPIMDRGTETVSPENNLVFNGPPISARVLAQAGIDIVSTANNHAWDYGQKGLLETIEWLDKENVVHVGSGATLEKAWEPVFIERSGFKLAFVAINDIWNQAHGAGRSAHDHVAGMDQEKLVSMVRALRQRNDIDAIAVSYHGGVEYQDEPLMQTREIAIAAIDAGADVFLGHHPHVVQGVTFHRDRPIVYSLGNLLMRMSGAYPATEMGLAVRIEFERGNVPRLFACPIRIFGVDPIPLGSDPQRTSYEPLFLRRLQRINRLVGTAIVGPFDASGCARVTSGT